MSDDDDQDEDDQDEDDQDDDQDDEDEFEDEDEDEVEDEDADEGAFSAALKRFSKASAPSSRRAQARAQDDEDEDDDDDDEDDEDEDEDDDDGLPHFGGPSNSLSSELMQMEKQMADEIRAMENEEAQSMQALSSTVQSDIVKGQHARTQTKLFDSFLETRIRLQSVVTVANRMPHPDKLPAFAREGGDQTQQALSSVQTEVADLLDKMLDLQQSLFQQNPEVASVAVPRSKRRQSTEEYWQSMSGTHKRFKPFFENTIEKWNSKIQLAAGGAGAKKFKALNQSVLGQISQVMTGKDRLIRRSQLKRGSYRVLGEDEHDTDKGDEYDEEIFDDQDLYQQLLRELIERRTSGMDTDDTSAMGKQWVEIQKLRAKNKRKVDTKASKGRKLRFQPHEKLVNFMAPVDRTTWTEQARTDLFTSLFGKTAAATAH
ncbi:hypothetical protein CAOG_007493 [Capsaspora owczarzaki ATCC 30864]|uniref:Uncharacterized protein n=2 Tax=Capsaspora owczarzaki (strain ATCC 30864) TaxID=595528 RepID=A0A0D2WVU4_CAPO3|nr:hypothetical protein CAOG_007493 [Capsaspora owczarzaki ATCC 30864]